MTKSKLKWIFQFKERHKTVNRRSRYSNNLNMTEISIFFNTRNKTFDFKIMQYFMEKKQTNKQKKCMSIHGLISLWYPHAMTFFIFSWHFHSENSLYIYDSQIVHPNQCFKSLYPVYFVNQMGKIIKTRFVDISTFYVSFLEMLYTYYQWKDILKKSIQS